MIACVISVTATDSILLMIESGVVTSRDRAGLLKRIFFIFHQSVVIIKGAQDVVLPAVTHGAVHGEIITM